jgi:8-oxo-dGTP pyrophosphatase MutT (NUDIX family)
MQHEKSCGALVVRRADDGKVYILMIRHKAGGHRSFPKGHMEPGETEYMTAVREVFEETAVQIRIDSDFRKTVHYHPMPGVSKEVVYFLTETTQCEIRPREGEIAQVEWVPLEQAEQSLTHENDKTVLRAAMKRLQDGSLNRKKANA